MPEFLCGCWVLQVARESHTPLHPGRLHDSSGGIGFLGSAGESLDLVQGGRDCLQPPAGLSSDAAIDSRWDLVLSP